LRRRSPSVAWLHPQDWGRLHPSQPANYGWLGKRPPQQRSHLHKGGRSAPPLKEPLPTESSVGVSPFSRALQACVDERSQSQGSSDTRQTRQRARVVSDHELSRATMTSQKRSLSQTLKNERRSIRPRIKKSPKLYTCKKDGCGQKFIKQHPHQLYCSLAHAKRPYKHSSPLSEEMKTSLQQCIVCPRYFKPLRREQKYCGPICCNKAWKHKQVINETPLATI
jgi:hypothetical protein